MSDQNTTTLTQCVERARKILQFEQRTHHQDQAVKPGGLESFVTRWADEASEICKSAGLDVRPIYRVTECLEGYRLQDPMQRAASLRSALLALTGLGNDTSPHTSQSERDQSRTEHGKVRHDERKHPIAEHDEVEHGRDTTSPYMGKTSASSAPVSARVKNEPKRANSAQRPPEQSYDEPEPVKAGQAKPIALQASKPKREEPSTSDFVRLEAGMSQGHTAMTLLTASVTSIPGVGPSIATKLNTLGIRTVRDLLFYFPREHRDYSKLVKIANIASGELITTMGMIWEVETKRLNSGRTITYATISDDTGKLRVSWFNQSYLQKQLQAAKGSYLVVTGKKQREGNKINFQVQSYEFPDQGDLLNTGRLVPTYALTEGLHAKTLRRFTKWAVDRYARMLPDHLPTQIRMANGLLTLPEAVSQFHYPESEQMLAAARRRLAFDELFLIQLGMQERRSRWQQQNQQGNAFSIDLSRIFASQSNISPHDDTSSTAPIPEETIGTTLWSMAATQKSFEETLPFAFTDAQRRVLHEIFDDLARTQPMCRLLQGDVGAGKTAVAAAALYVAALNGFQGAIMAPTELLAEQHAHSIGAMLEPFGIRTVLLTGSLRQKERTANRAMLESGEAAVAIGTHALIQEDVAFHKLGLVIVDEQHRFGVEQRDALRKKGYHPHMLVMTATPIPRTLALTLYGDLDVSVIDQLPPGRQKIITRWRSGARRPESYTTIIHQVEEGHQAFIICPLIEESESLAVKAATVEYERLKREVFPYKRLGLLHGAMKAVDKDAAMRQFRDHELDILVATSVIEVGIDIPNATVMVIEDADRFGLSQLHQFRGRVGRGKAQSFCYVLSADAGLNAQERLGVFEDTDDGFRLAEEDLRLRGPGEFFGVRQSGTPELKIANLNDIQLVELARSLADTLWARDPYLRQPEHTALREKMALFWQNFIGH